ncbi:unnamed protein product [Linum trigynum]|uniref:Uncharacterized protein n=1 Tax=Linum trigynum TaxID=586398 RepID=A0AAV2GIN8_9ROSI
MEWSQESGLVALFLETEANRYNSSLSMEQKWPIPFRNSTFRNFILRFRFNNYQSHSALPPSSSFLSPDFSSSQENPENSGGSARSASSATLIVQEETMDD